METERDASGVATKHPINQQNTNLLTASSPSAVLFKTTAPPDPDKKGVFDPKQTARKIKINRTLLNKNQQTFEGELYLEDRDATTPSIASHIHIPSRNYEDLERKMDTIINTLHAMEQRLNVLESGTGKIHIYDNEAIIITNDAPVDHLYYARNDEAMEVLKNKKHYITALPGDIAGLREELDNVRLDKS